MYTWYRYSFSLIFIWTGINEFLTEQVWFFFGGVEVIQHYFDTYTPKDDRRQLIEERAPKSQFDPGFVLPVRAGFVIGGAGSIEFYPHLCAPPVNPAPLSCRPEWRRTQWDVMKRRHLQASKMFLSPKEVRTIQMMKLLLSLKQRRRCLRWIQEQGGVSAPHRKGTDAPVDMTGGC